MHDVEEQLNCFYLVIWESKGRVKIGRIFCFLPQFEVFDVTNCVIWVNAVFTVTEARGFKQVFKRYLWVQAAHLLVAAENVRIVVRIGEMVS